MGLFPCNIKRGRGGGPRDARAAVDVHAQLGERAQQRDGRRAVRARGVRVGLEESAEPRVGGRGMFRPPSPAPAVANRQAALLSQRSCRGDMIDRK